MKVISPIANKDKNGKNTILVELNEDDIEVLNSAIRDFTKIDRDDRKYNAKLEHNKEQIHKAFTILRPS